MGDAGIRKASVRMMTPDVRATKPKPPPKAESPAPARGWAPKSDGRVAANSQGDRVELRAEKPGPSAPVPTVVREALTTSWRNLWVGEQDVATAHRSLEGLSMPDYQAALQQLQKDGLLARYVDAMDVPQRAAFLDQAMRKGVLSAQPGEKASGPFAPPQSPRLYVQSAALPEPLRQAVHQGNIEAAVGYHHAYSEYVDRYAAAVMKQEDAEGIRRLGPPSPMALLTEPGLDDRHPNYRSFMNDWVTRSRRAPSDKPCWDAISNRMDDLTGEVRPGSFWLQLEVEVVKKDGVVTRATGGDVTLRNYGQLELGAKKSIGLEADGGLVKLGGKLEGKGDVKLQRGLHPHVGGEVEAKGNVQLGMPHGPSIGLEASLDGTRELSLNLDEHVGSYAKANREEATLEGGVKLKKELSNHKELEVKVGFGGKAAPARVISVGIDRNSKGFFGATPERDARVPWNELSVSAQERYRSFGYDEKTWRNW